VLLSALDHLTEAIVGELHLVRDGRSGGRRVARDERWSTERIVAPFDAADRAVDARRDRRRLVGRQAPEPIVEELPLVSELILAVDSLPLRAIRKELAVGGRRRARRSSAGSSRSGGAFLGLRGVLAQSHEGKPKSFERKRELSPAIACKNRTRRVLGVCRPSGEDGSVRMQESPGRGGSA
jgi:hypothetical protein